MKAYSGFLVSLVVFGVLPEASSSFETASHSCLFRTAPASSIISPSGTYSQPKLPLQRNGSTKLQGTFLITAAAAADAFWKNSPYTAAAVVCGIKASAADFVAQRRHYKKRIKSGEDLDVVMNEDGSLSVKELEKVNLQRNMAYILYGSMYQGLAQEFIYNHIYPALFGAGTDLVTVASKVMFNMIFQTTLVTLPIAYMSKAMIFRYSLKEAFRRYIDDIKHHKLLVKFYMLWLPVMSLAFSIIPEHFQVTFIAMVSFFWLIILSSIANKAPIIQDEECTLVDGNTCNIDG